MSQKILNICDLDLCLKGRIGLHTFNISVETFKNQTISNFNFQLELFIHHLNVPDGFENG